MEFFTTKIVDQPVEGKINLEEINGLLSSLELPESFSGVDKVTVGFVAREPNDFEFDTWQEDKERYFFIPLVYNEILNLEEEKVSLKCVDSFKEYIKKLQEEEQ